MTQEEVRQEEVRKEEVRKETAIRAAKNRITVSFLIIIVLSVLILTGFGFSVRENQKRIDDIQKSRVLSCRQNYDGIQEVFTQFFPPVPRTAKQQADIDKFNNTISRLKKNCIKQTATSELILESQSEHITENLDILRRYYASYLGSN